MLPIAIRRTCSGASRVIFYTIRSALPLGSAIEGAALARNSTWRFRNREWRELRGELWLNFCLSTTGTNPYQFAKEYLGEVIAGAKLIYKWTAKEVRPTRKSASKAAGLAEV